MKTMSLIKFGLGRVDSVETDAPVPGPTEVLVKVLACGVCRTDLHVVDGGKISVRRHATPDTSSMADTPNTRLHTLPSASNFQPNTTTYMSRRCCVPD
jgi:NADPH:quinone reductase-like Zn-dependent oxidoreductase